LILPHHRREHTTPRHDPAEHAGIGSVRNNERIRPDPTTPSALRIYGRSNSDSGPLNGCTTCYRAGGLPTIAPAVTNHPKWFQSDIEKGSFDNPSSSFTTRSIHPNHSFDSSRANEPHLAKIPSMLLGVAMVTRSSCTAFNYRCIDFAFPESIEQGFMSTTTSSLTVPGLTDIDHCPQLATAAQQRLLGSEKSMQLAMKENAEDMQAVAHIRAKVRKVVVNEDAFNVLSSTEKVAVALVLDRVDWMRSWGTILERADYIGSSWLSAALYIQRKGWGGDE
jgi:hypothetical protein